VHHTVTQLDVLGSSRNSLWSSFFILYLWIHTLMLYLLDNPSGYLWGISLTAALDLWRHSQLGPHPQSWLYRWLSPWLILPQDHARHHAYQSAQQPNYNFGANLKLWDILHNTAQQADHFPKKLGVNTTLRFWQKLLYPFELS
jgi:sterol desaturase/sphingolipid hydroxylase (fatty acid hydroxylase superfamily)